MLAHRNPPIVEYTDALAHRMPPHRIIYVFFDIMQRATILRSNLARQGVKTTTQVQKMQRNVAVRARVETLFLEEGFVAPEFTLPWPEKGFQSTSLMKDVVKVRLSLRRAIWIWIG